MATAMVKRATLLLVAATALGGCFKLEYNGDVLFACDPGEAPDKRCPGGYACTTPIPGEGVHRCRRICDPQQADCPPDLRCLPVGVEGEHVCTPDVPPPDKDAGPDGKVKPPDGPQPVPACTGHYVVGSLGDAALFDLVAVSDDDVLAVWIDEANKLQVKPRKGPSWMGEIGHGLLEPIDRVGAVLTDSGLLVVFRPGKEKSVVKQCVMSQSPPGSCAPDLLLDDQSAEFLDLDLAKGKAGTVLAVSQVHRGNSPVVKVYSLTAKPSMFQANLDCTHDPKSDLELPRVAVGDGAWIASVRQRSATGDEQWQLLTANGGRTGVCAPGLAYPAAPEPTPANLAVDGMAPHLALEIQPDPGHTQHTSWDDINKPPPSPPPPAKVTDRVLPGSSSLALAKDVPLISAIPDPLGPFDRNPARVWRGRPVGGGFQQLPRPTPDSPDNAPSPKGKKSGTRSRIAVAPDGKRVHVLYDAHYGPTDKHVLVYYQCDITNK